MALPLALGAAVLVAALPGSDSPWKQTASPSPYWQPPAVGSVNSLGLVTIPLAGDGKVALLAPSITPRNGALVCRATAWNSAGTSLAITYAQGLGAVHVTIQLQPTAVGMSAEITADQPIISAVDMGPWNPQLNASAIPVPYYSGAVWYARGISRFVNVWWDWRATSASALNWGVVQYQAKTNGTLNRLHEVMQVAVSPDVDAVFPSPANPPSPFISTLAGRTVLDIWDAGFSGIQQGLADLGDYGLTNCVAIVHGWQYAGFDNALPQHFPANAGLGGTPGIKAVIAQAKADGCLAALHENYIDYYPNYPNFNPASVALNSNGSRMKAFLNPSTGIQSYAAKPPWMVTNAAAQSPLIHQAYATTAGFLDVVSSIAISSRGDFDSSVSGAAKLTSFMAGCQALWAYARKIHQGPVLGEGMNHWYYSGLLDGVEAQTGAGAVPENRDSSLPLFLDFDLLKIHPLQVNHGMGYYQRWTANKSSRMTATQLDAYRMQEVAFGHAPFLSIGLWSDLPVALQESHLVGPVAASYGGAAASRIEYRANGSWVNPSTAARTGRFAQAQVTYSNGTTVVATADLTPLSWRGITLPQFGWVAMGKNLKAYTALCGRVICDYAQTSTSYFANARNQADFQIGSGYASPSVASVTQGRGNTLAIRYAWNVYRPLPVPANEVTFVHFVNDAAASVNNPAIAFQDDHVPVPAPDVWTPGSSQSEGPRTVSIPSTVVDGTYSIRIGLYNPATGARLALAGDDDGTGRYIVGHLTVSDHGSKVSFTPPAPPANDPRLNAAGSVVNFGPLQTDGMVSIIQSGGQWILRPYPRYRRVVVLLNRASFREPASVQATGGPTATVTPVARRQYWSIPVNGAKYYTWPVE